MMPAGEARSARIETPLPAEPDFILEPDFVSTPESRKLGSVRRNASLVARRVAAAAVAAGRSPAEVTILLATKTQPRDLINIAMASLRHGVEKRPFLLGENRVQELVAKDATGELRRLSEYFRAPLHFIGPLQKNKINALLATPVSCIETIDSIELAEAVSSRLERQGELHDDSEPVGSARLGRPMDVMVQVNVSGEASKAGCLPDDAAALALAVAKLPMLNLTGFMTIGLRPVVSNHAPVRDSAPASPAFLAQNDENEITNSDEIKGGYRLLREIRDAINPHLELSMGMSTDLELAIAEGATIVRIGSAIFGSR